MIKVSATGDARAQVMQLIDVYRARVVDVGPESLIVEAKPNREDPRPENNVRSARVNVIEYKPRVLLIDDEARWEFRYLRNAAVGSRARRAVPALPDGQ